MDNSAGSVAFSVTVQDAEIDAEAVSRELVAQDVSRSSSSSAEGLNQPKSPKSVLFDSRSTSHGHSKKFQSVADCWECMVQGSNLIKIRPNGRTYNRYFSLDSDLSAVRWVPTSKKASKALILVSTIREVRFGHNAEVSGIAQSTVSGTTSASLDCAFSVVHGDDFLSLDLVASSPEEASVWVTGIKALLGSQTSLRALGETAGLRERWLRDAFERAASDCAHDDDDVDAAAVPASFNLDQTTAMALLKEINADLATSRIKQKMAEVDSMKSVTERGRINSQDFVSMFQEMATRPEIHFLLVRFANKDLFTVEDFRQFLECEQELRNVSLDFCQQLIQLYEPSTEAKQKNQLLLDGMTKYLLSEEGDIFDSVHLHVHHDMSQSIVDYFISTSHNTYLLEDQLRGPSSVEGYVRALQSGCRCVKIDVWDGPDAPVVCHGNTLTTKIAFADAVAIIAEYAFEISEYPLFIHLENHCSAEQQKLVARILKQNFQNFLYKRGETSKHITVCSPEELRGKGKKLSDASDADGEVSDEDEGAETNRRRAPARRVHLTRELSDVISMHRSTATKLPVGKDKSLYNASFSLSESGAARLQSSSPSTWSEVTQKSFLRVFPNGSRVDSSNFNPQDFWNAGVQMVALNFQTPGLMMDLYDGKFRQNGGCGFVLKPRIMRQPGFSLPLNYKDNCPLYPPQLLTIRIISGQQLPRPRGSSAKATVVDPYVLVQIYGISVDCCEKKTKTVPDEGDCPLFEESLEFYIHHPQMALVRFVVLDDEYIGDDFIGQYTIPFTCIRPGYRHIRLLSNLGEALENATLFVHVSITEKWAGECLQKGKTKQTKKQATIRMTGIKQTDDAFKAVIPHLVEANRARRAVANSLFELRSECGLGIAASIQYCLRVLLQRLASCSEVKECSLSIESEIPVLKIETLNGSLPAPVHRTVVALERLLLECYSLSQKSSLITLQLMQLQSSLLELQNQLDVLVNQSGLKGKQAHRVHDVYGWNMMIINTQMDLLSSCKADCLSLLDKVRTSDVQLSRFRFRTLENLNRPSISVTASPLTEESSPSNGKLCKGTLEPGSRVPGTEDQGLLEPKLKGILKKSGSSNDMATLEGYSRLCSTPVVVQQGSPGSGSCTDDCVDTQSHLTYVPCPPKEYPEEDQ